MRFFLILGLVFGLVCLFLFSSVAPAWACHCPRAGIRQRLQKSTLVFQGVAERETVGSHIFFRVEKSWKGLADVQEIDLKFRNLERCGVNPTMGHSFLVFSGKTGFDSCAIKETIDSEKEIAFLNSTKK